MQYVQDNNEALPQAMRTMALTAAPSDPTSGRYKWMDAVYPYVKSTQVFSCPDDSGIDGGTGEILPYSRV